MANFVIFTHGLRKRKEKSIDNVYGPCFRGPHSLAYEYQGAHK
jgi:hypothetical protein